MPFALAFNTAVSFMTNTNWQAYSGEATMSYFTQMAGLGRAQFRQRRDRHRRCTCAHPRADAENRRRHSGIFGPISRAARSTYCCRSRSFSRSCSWNKVWCRRFDGYPTATTIEGASQQIPLGPAASQIAIKQLGTNGGGFFGQNSAHPFENPTPLTNFLEMFAIFAIPSALVYMFGVMTGDRRQGWAIWAAMFVALSGRIRNRVVGGGATQSCDSVSRGRWKAKNALRRDEQRALGHRDDRRLERRGQRHARFTLAAGGARARWSTSCSAK